MICYYASRQEYSDRTERRRANELHYTRIHEWKLQVNSSPDLAHRPTNDILLELGIGQHQPRSV